MKDWSSCARWIWTAPTEEPNQYAAFRQSFSWSGESAVQLYISADSQFAAFINGQHIPLSQYADYPADKVYEQADINDQLHPGVNVLCILGYCQGESSSVYRRGQPGLLFAVVGEEGCLAASGTATRCRPSPAYRSGAVERLSSQLSFSFRYDARQEDGWLAPDYAADAGWDTAFETGYAPPLRPRPIQNLQIQSPCAAALRAQGVFRDENRQAPCGDRMQQAFLSARRARDLGADTGVRLPRQEGVAFRSVEGDGLYFLLDLEREESGLLELELTLPEEAEVLVGFGEHLDDLRVRSSIGGRQFAAVYYAKAGWQRFTHYFKRIGCRYVMLLIFAHACTLHYAGLRPVRYPVRYRPLYHGNDTLHNRIAAVSRRTLELCMHEHYEDCPWREQAMYAMDSRNQMLCGYFAFGETAFPRACLQLMAEGLREDGLLELCFPAEVPITIPTFSLSFVVALEEYATYSRDVPFVRELFPVMERLLETFLAREDPAAPFSGAAYWNFYEWRSGLDGYSPTADAREDAPLLAWLLLALQAASRLCVRIGEAEKAAVYHRRYTQLSQAAATFWDEERGAYATYREADGLRHYAELTQALMLCAGVPEDAQCCRLLQTLSADTDALIPISLSYRIFKYDALMTAPGAYKQWILEDIAAVWGRMLLQGATSFWETERGAEDFDQAGSLCHGWSATPLYFYHRYVLGEKPDSIAESLPSA